MLQDQAHLVPVSTWKWRQVKLQVTAVSAHPELPSDHLHRIVNSQIKKSIGNNQPFVSFQCYSLKFVNFLILFQGRLNTKPNTKNMLTSEHWYVQLDSLLSKGTYNLDDFG